MLAAEVASDLRKNNSNPTAAEVRERIVQQTSRPDDAHNDCVDLVMEFVKPRVKERKKGLYSELACRTLLLETGVRRGPDWKFHEQDSGLPGTVVGQDSDNVPKAVWVEWDNGHLNIYAYDEPLEIYSIKKVDEPRVLVDELVAVGCKDWTYADADGGPGSVGTVLCVNQDGSVLVSKITTKFKLTLVRWDSRSTGEYKMGMNGLFEIQIWQV
ncbi:unnamed protein product [Mytilus edulis]|uniref:MIB/HERC2 domain-containing protein n=1 Tax=Mytilus edulis TaxID=6550 RepID=A0A8S3QMU4_MYTED|nr:unnamed protein product [Mytilus edulis]